MTMDYETQLKLQALLDGELPEGAARQVANQLACDQEAASLMAELRQTRQVLRGTDSAVSLPESREFFWSKVRNEIERLEKPSRQPERVSFLARFRRVLIPAGALSVALLAALFVAHMQQEPELDTEMVLADAGTFTYRDAGAGETLIWVSYPADDDQASDDDDTTTEP
jgi:anti-sigma factor RsiW